jgi:RHS repeat-associated protein
LYYAHDGNKNVSEVVSDENEIFAHYEYAPFGAVTLAMGEYAFSNPWRFSSEYADDSLVLVYYNYRHYEPVYGRWMGRDPYENSHEINNYLMCINKSFDAFDVLGLWSSFIIMTHQNMVKESIGQLRSRIKSLQSRVARYVIASEIIDGNVGMDRGTNANATKEALPLHYNVAEGQTPFDAINRFKKGLSNKRKEVKIGLESEFLSDAKCKEILRILGEVTHMLQDYYGHGVSWLYVKGADDKLIGNTYGSPDAIKENLPEGALVKLVLKPSMYIGHFSSSEHGPLWWSEPGNRAPDRDNRHRDSVAMTVKELNEYLPTWCDKCCVTLRQMEKTYKKNKNRSRGGRRH